MDGRIDDVDDLLNTSSSSSSGYSHPPRFNYTPPSHSLLDDDGFSFRPSIGEGDSSSSVHPTSETPSFGYQNAPRVFDRFEYSASSSDENEELYDCDSWSDAGQKRLDYMTELHDRKLSMTSFDDLVGASQKNQSQSLPEFIGRGGGTGIFKLPVRCAVENDKPPCLELRPQPLRETQIGKLLKNIVCVDDGRQLWAGSECGIRAWDLANMYGKAQVVEEESETYSEDTPPFVESAPPVAATLCLVAVDAHRKVLSGHIDGRIRCWKMADVNGGCGGDGGSALKERFSWQAHRGPVLSMVMTSYGDLWSGSEGGAIMIWQWEAIEKAEEEEEEKHMGSSLVLERSYVDMRSKACPNGTYNNIFSYDIKFLLSDQIGAKVWSASYLSFALWDARTRELLKLFNIHGQIENMSSLQDPIMEEDKRTRIVSGFKKDKGFLQRSRNVIRGAADVVRRVAVKGAFGEDNRRTEALVRTIDGMIWTGLSNGSLIQWDGDGNRVQDFHHHFSSVGSFCTYGPRIWVCYGSGMLHVLDLDGNIVGCWVAHRNPVIDLTVGNGYVFTLASHGGIRGWSITSPGPLDNILCSELTRKDFVYTSIKNLKVLAGTWNVGQERAAYGSLISWLGSSAADMDIVVVGLQEVEMGARFLAMSAAKETVGLEGSSLGQWWLDMIGKTLDEGSMFLRIGSRQLAGLLIATWIKSSIKDHVGDVDVSAVPCGLGRAIGNKGAVGLRMTVYSRTMCFVNCHFAAHLDAVNRRNDDFNHVYQNMIFSRPSTNQIIHSPNGSAIESGESKPELSEADMIVFLGDLNYRLEDISYDEARDFITQRCFDWLREKDQLRAEMAAGNAFQGLREAAIKFPPTYKFEKYRLGLTGYDSGEKRRIPAWCDRILYRDSRSDRVSPCSLECPVVSSVLLYDACMDVTDSDHKPVRCIMNVEIAHIDESLRRQEFGEIVHSNLEFKAMFDKICRIPEVIISTSNMILQNLDVSVLRITNKYNGKEDAFFEIICEGDQLINNDDIKKIYDHHHHRHHPRGSFGFPRWLKVSPVGGIIKPDKIMEIKVYHEDYETLEDARDKQVILVVNVKGSYSNEAKSHRIRVRHTFSAQIQSEHGKNENPDDIPTANLLLRADFHRLSDSSDVFDHLPNMHTP